MKIAVIDIGTNTVLLLVAQIDEAGAITPLAYEQRVPRLGKDVDGKRILRPDSMHRVVHVLKEYKAIMDRFAPDMITVAGTSAVRDAHNRSEFVELVRKESGFTLEVLSGNDEAYWTYRGAISGIPGAGHATVVDIGGGSTEITIGDATTIHSSISLDVGSVRLTERFFRRDPPTHPELEAAITCVEDELSKLGGFNYEGTTLIGVAGTATSLALLAQAAGEFRIEAVTSYHLQRDQVYTLFRMLREMSASRILALSTVMQGRNDVITAGTLILREIMAHLKFDEMIVSERGVRYGLAIREWETIRSQQRERTL